VLRQDVEADEPQSVLSLMIRIHVQPYRHGIT
jgi:hypothetical protein